MGCLVFQNAISFICYSFGWEDGVSLSFDKHEVGQFKISFFILKCLIKFLFLPKGKLKRGIKSERIDSNSISTFPIKV